MDTREKDLSVKAYLALVEDPSVNASNVSLVLLENKLKGWGVYDSVQEKRYGDRYKNKVLKAIEKLEPPSSKEEQKLLDKFKKILEDPERSMALIEEGLEDLL